jgi:hypothetical protein
MVPLALLLIASAALAQEKATRTDGEKKAIAKVQQLGGLVLELAQNDPHLEVSYLQKEGKFTDDYLMPLKALNGLVHLNLRGQDVTDAQTTLLKGLVSLTRLHLEQTKITDKGLANLQGLTNLEYLNLYGTAVTDAGLDNLIRMRKLKHLYLWQTKVTDAGVAKLKKILPQAEIVRGFDLELPKEVKSAAAKPPAAKATPKPAEKKVDAKKPEKKSDAKKK